jgi:hypothetical protein
MAKETGGPAFPRTDLIERFWSNVKKSEGCWIWTGRRSWNGKYGSFFLSSLPRNHSILAHRFSWEIVNASEIPRGLDACHSCDTPLCVRPNHIFIGTRKQNMQDAVRKGRFHSPKGETNPAAKLSRQSIIEIVRKASAGMTHRQIASGFGVAHSTVGRILRGELWAHICGAKS